MNIPLLEGAKPIRAFKGNLSLGNNDLIPEVPANKKCIILPGGTQFNTSTARVTWFSKIKVGNNYYRTSSNFQLLAGLKGKDNVLNTAMILNEGEGLSIHVSEGAGMNFFCPAILFDASETRIKTYRKLELTPGENILCPMPQWKSGNLSYLSYGANGVCIVVNDTPNTVRYIFNQVPSGEQVNLSNQASPISFVEGFKAFNEHMPTGMNEGDKYVVQLLDNAPKQLAYLTTIEV